MKLPVTTFDGKESGEVTLDKSIFGAEFRADILHRVVRWQLAKRQSGLHKTKERNEISATTKKPFKQKGTGNARQGTRVAPHHRGGGVAHGARVRSHAHDLPKKIRSLGLRIALSKKVADGSVTILKDAELKKASTKSLIGNKNFNQGSALLIDVNVNENFAKSAANIPGLNAIPVIGANVYDILKHQQLILTSDAVSALEARLK